MRAGNKNNGFLTSRAYKNIAEHYYLRTGLRHSRQQLKNRWQQLKKIYSFWLSLNKKTGNGSIFEDDNFWETHTKGNTELQNLRFGPPEWLDQFEIMYEHIAIDGSTSCIPGEDTIEEDEEEDNDDSPMNDARRKGGNNTGSCATSSRKKSKMPMPKIMKGIWDTMQKHNNIIREVGHGEVLADTVKKGMKLVVECGAKPGSQEHFMARQLFEKPVQREIFFTLETKEERLNWLKMWCQKKNK
ncbi:hypothetical protein U9M48_041186 [Paspalum notatum var. saurae]|uniref:Myb/SANT-like domain-containing protein n=1 Tax=Paspalum notatum var. saurae TaxID=547442 RepID=A0AAQ3UMN5_PASNO